jgi:general secretion pathway protein H
MRRRNGFTLLEVMVVIVIIGVLVTVTTIAVGALGRDREVEDESRRFAALLTQAREEAELQGLDIGVMVNRHGYEFFVFDALKQQWQPIAEDDFYVTRALPEGLQARLWMEDREVELAAEAYEEKSAEGDDADDKENDEQGLGIVNTGPAPQITLLSSGEINDFELRIERDGTDHVWRVALQDDATLRAEEYSDIPPP